LLAYGHAALTEDASAPAPMLDSGKYGSDIGAWFEDWFARSDAAKDSQAHWMTPLVPVTPRLEQEFRQGILLGRRCTGGARHGSIGRCGDRQVERVCRRCARRCGKVMIW
jgi:hypothetical protein